ncbi:MAG: bifunctional 5,10-methylenetetrahydrofolate dehydrogenase/5,10-methenyltetrahydrofolate cyclohydrolase [Candidatus Nomurabacteria bacterium]|jgi:methylenetetrahydrofolate dehydrogenase (NADP+)/methenyltetrahydrofolate cyclohydrolase|nr:bifunctional 5,10-methylenetetrahydrofolate dehydrogenase/5,10-methenyltetrahydrofolate cyclohydrolase [Candidatus Nomurabacteria bacterium]
MKWLDGAELASYMQEQQAVEVRRLKGAWAERGEKGRTPKLLILQDHENKVSEIYVKKKLAYAEEIGAEAEFKIVEPEDLATAIATANADESVDGIIVQLPILGDYAVLDTILPEKDVDGLRSDNGTGGEASEQAAAALPIFQSATAEAINYLLTAYDVELKGKKIAIIGYGRLVGKPLARMWQGMGLDVSVFRSKDAAILPEVLPEFDVVVSGTGVAGLVKPEMLKTGAVVVDAGTATDKNGISGDFAPEVLERTDLTMTKKVGGVGPVTVATLFAHLLQSARNRL